MNNNTTQFKGYLFESIGYKTDNDLRNLIDTMDIQQSIFFINTCLQYSHSKGVFTLIESEIISKSLAIINSKILMNDTDGEGTDSVSNN